MEAPESCANMLPAPSTRYRCGFPGCAKRYASTDGVRKHARKMHTQWLKNVDETSASRDREHESKPSTYCIMEMDDQNTKPHASNLCRDIDYDAMPPHLRQAVDSSMRMSLGMPPSSMHPYSSSMMLHAAPPPSSMPPMNAPLLSRADYGSYYSPPHDSPPHDPYGYAMPRFGPVGHDSLASELPLSRAGSMSDLTELSRLPPPPLPPQPEYVRDKRDMWSSQFEALMARAESQMVGGKRRCSPPLEVEFVDPLCWTPPMAPSTNAADNKCLSPFELEEKRPAKLARISDVPLLPEKPRAPISGSLMEMLSDGLPPPPPRSPLVEETEYFDFVEALMAL